MNPPQDGTVIWATGNIMYEVKANEDEWDSPTIGTGAEYFEAAIFWCSKAQLWLWFNNRMSVRQCLSDEIYFHWWTALEGGGQ